MLELDGERILNSEVEIGYLHRGFEKTCENKTYFNLLIYTDRLNYVSPLINNLGYAMTMEKMLGVDVPERAQLIRVLMSELSRVSDHLTCLAAMAMESGAFTVFLYKMKAREFLWDVIEQTTGARMTTSYIRIGGVRADLHPGLAGVGRDGRPRDAQGPQGRPRACSTRTASSSAGPATSASCPRRTRSPTAGPGPASGRRGSPTTSARPAPISSTTGSSFEVPVGERGDNYDRYSVRMREMEQSLRIIEQVAALIPDAAPLAGRTGDRAGRGHPQARGGSARASASGSRRTSRAPRRSACPGPPDRRTAPATSSRPRKIPTRRSKGSSAISSSS